VGKEWLAAARLKGEIEALEQVSIKKNCFEALDEIEKMRSVEPSKQETEDKSNYN